MQPTGELGRALVLADELGFLRHAQLTPAGLRLLQPEAPSTLQELPMTEPAPQPHLLTTHLKELVEFYDRQLAVPEVQQSPRVEYIRNMREMMEMLAAEEELKQNEVLLMLHAQRHALTGIPAEELGYPANPEQEDAVKTILESTGKFLQKRAVQHGPHVQRVVNDLAEGYAPSSAGDVAALLAVLLYVKKRKRIPRRKSLVQA